MSPDDQGQVTVGIAADCQHNVIRIDFAKSVSWLAFDVAGCEDFIKMLEQKIDEIKSGPLQL